MANCSSCRRRARPRADPLVILFFHGGPIRQMLLGWHPMDAYAYFYAMNQYLASEGYVVLSVNYRGGTGYGLNWREAENFGPGGSSVDNDIVGARALSRRRARMWTPSVSASMAQATAAS